MSLPDPYYDKSIAAIDNIVGYMRMVNIVNNRETYPIDRILERIIHYNYLYKKNAIPHIFDYFEKKVKLPKHIIIKVAQLTK